MNQGGVQHLAPPQHNYLHLSDNNPSPLRHVRSDRNIGGAPGLGRSATLNQINKASASASGLGFEFGNNVEVLRQSCRMAQNHNWSGVDFTQFQDLIENMQQADQKNWEIDQQSMDNLCCSLNTFFRRTGVMPDQSHSASAGHAHISQQQQHMPHGHPSNHHSNAMTSPINLRQSNVAPPPKYNATDSQQDDIDDNFDWDSIC
uniref:Transcription factor protein n=1 Tax=Phallusia mammillata TaxID=59560 RepID=A0A6F9DEX8_9ASCI|nr:transcription factor protein [Phallusia mammillata]